MYKCIADGRLEMFTCCKSLQLIYIKSFVSSNINVLFMTDFGMLTSGPVGHKTCWFEVQISYCITLESLAIVVKSQRTLKNSHRMSMSL